MTMNTLDAIATLSDDALLARLEDLAGRARSATAELIAHLAELARRKAHRAEGEGSLFKYCTQVLRLSQAAACNRIAAAYAARRFPMILDLLARGSVNLTTIRLLAPQLTEDNHRAVLAQAAGCTKEEVLEIRARLSPQADVRPSVRRLPERQPTNAAAALVVDARTGLSTVASDSSSSTAGPGESPVPKPAVHGSEPSRPTVVPVAPERYAVHMTIDKETRDDLRVVQDLVRRTIPDGDPGRIFARALKLLRAELERKVFSATTRPRDARPAKRGSRDIPADVQRAIWARDGGQCAFVGRRGRCSERSFLEFHHRHPHAFDGEATADNIALRCRAHNQYEAELVFGPRQPMAVRETADRSGAGH